VLPPAAFVEFRFRVATKPLPRRMRRYANARSPKLCGFRNS
jgi:hypothetical protein